MKAYASAYLDRIDEVIAKGLFRVFKEAAAVAYSQKDIRFTYRAPCI
ncbi:MAG: hypothetical protein GX626_11100 [Spirochaetales bacterium]|nr:hypothetical protein [Spirochaetales bacterium]